jgi:Ubiquitin-2 like Rad60 SUMO-like
MASSSTSAIPPKKSFFKRPAWGTSAPPADAGDFFRHSDKVYDRILEEKERRKQRHAQRKEAKAKAEVVEDGREKKRRRISIEDEDDEDGQTESDAGSHGSSRSNPVNGRSSTNGVTFPPKSQTARAPPSSPSKTKSQAQPTPASSTNIIELDSDNDGPEVPPNAGQEQSQKRVSDEELSEEEDDEYVQKLKREAREKAQLAQLGVDRGFNRRENLPPRNTPQPRPSHDRDRSTPDATRAAPTPSPKKEETIVQILISTRIPNSKPLLVNRKVSQPLQQVRQVWCSRQNFDEETAAKVMFTWRGNRLYDTTTSIHLLETLKSEHSRKMGALEEDDNEDPSYGRIEVEAITKDMYEQRLLQKHRDEADAGADDPSNSFAQDRQSVESSSTPKEKEYQIVMNSPGMEAMHLKVRPSTLIAKMMAAYKKLRNVDPGKTCWLVFDGDRLEPESTIGDTEIEDGDAIEVHVR